MSPLNGRSGSRVANVSHLVPLRSSPTLLSEVRHGGICMLQMRVACMALAAVRVDCVSSSFYSKEEDACILAFDRS